MRLHSRTEQAPAIRSVGLPPGHEIAYVVDIPASLSGNGLVLEVTTRNRKKDGEWSKPKGLCFSMSEIADLPDATDRQVLAILAGGREQVSGLYSGYGYYYENTTVQFHLSHALSEALLPMLCATGRGLLRESARTA